MLDEPSMACTIVTTADYLMHSKNCAIWEIRCWLSSTMKKPSDGRTTWSILAPAPVRHGGEIVAHGTPDEIAQTPTSLTGAYMSGDKQ